MQLKLLYFFIFFTHDDHIVPDCKKAEMRSLIPAYSLCFVFDGCLRRRQPCDRHAER